MEDDSDTVIKLCTRHKVPPKQSLKAFRMTYTQVQTNSDNSSIRPDTQGWNRDAVEASVITPDFAVCVVADGCSLRYWSEVTAKVAAHKFVSYMERYIWALDKDVTVSQLKQEMIQAILYTNQELINLVHPQSGQRVFLDENGGQTTLTAAIVFPYLKNMWGVIVVGMGDSEALLFKHGSEEIEGNWIRLSEDEGGTMLPFMNLKEYQISKPKFHTFDNGTIFLFSDGVRSSFPSEQIPTLPYEFTETTWHMGQYIMQQSFSSHTTNATDPDDVCVGGISLRHSSEDFQYYGKGYPYREPQVDMTKLFLPDFNDYDPLLVSEFIDLKESIIPNTKKRKQINAWLEKSTKSKKNISQSIQRSLLQRGNTSPARVEGDLDDNLTSSIDWPTASTDRSTVQIEGQDNHKLPLPDKKKKSPPEEKKIYFQEPEIISPPGATSPNSRSPHTHRRTMFIKTSQAERYHRPRSTSPFLPPASASINSDSDIKKGIKRSSKIINSKLKETPAPPPPPPETIEKTDKSDKRKSKRTLIILERGTSRKIIDFKRKSKTLNEKKKLLIADPESTVGNDPIEPYS